MIMDRMKPAPLILAVLINMLFSMSALADDQPAGPAESSVNSRKQFREWDAQLTVALLPAADFLGMPGDASIADYRLKITRNLRIDERLTLIVGGGYGLKHIDASSGASLPQDLHALFLEAGARYRINEKAFASVRLSPGFYSDFNEIGTDDLRMPVLALGGYSFDDSWSVVGGLIYRFGSHSSRFMPALGFSYQPNEAWRFDMVAPRPTITYSASRQLQLFVAGDFASDEFEVHDQAFGARAIKYSDYKVLAGVGFLPVPEVKLSTSIGYAFDRRFVFYDSFRPDLRLEDAPFFRVSLDVGW